MRRKWVGQVDEAGKTLEGYVAYLAPKRQNGFHGRWFAMAQEALKVLKTFTHLDDFRVLVALLEQLDYENMIFASQADIGRDLSMSSAQVNRAIKRLVEVGAILRGPKRGINCSYKLNPNFGWKGSAKNHVEALDKHRNERMKSANITGVVEGGEPEPDPK